MKNKTGAYTYKEDEIVLDNLITVEEKGRLLQRRPVSINRRLDNLKEMGITPAKLGKEKQFIIDTFPDANLTDIASYLKVKYTYVRDRQKELKKLALLRENRIVVEGDIEYILKNRNKLSYAEIAKQTELNRNLVNILVDIHDRRKESRLQKEQLERENTKLQFPDYMQSPEGSIDKKDIEKRQYEKGKLYEVISKKSDQSRQKIRFKGELLGEYENYILIKDAGGRKESFLKVDFMTGQARIKEVI